MVSVDGEGVNITIQYHNYLSGGIHREVGNIEKGGRGVRKIFLGEKKTQLSLRAVVETCHTDNNRMVFRKEGESMFLKNPFLSQRLYCHTDETLYSPLCAPLYLHMFLS